MSEIKIRGKDLRAANLLRACKNFSTVKSSTISKWPALVTLHVSKHIYTLLIVTHLLHMKSPSEVDSCNLKGSGILYYDTK